MSNCTLENNEIKTNKRKNCISWDEYFLATAFLAAKRSKDPETQVGACLVDGQNRIVGIGYNGFPRGCHDDEFPWSKNDPDPMNQKYMYVVHAETNAILNKNVADTSGCRIYVTLFPCNECAKVIIQSGVKEVVYCSDKHSHKSHTQGAKRMFDAAGVKFRQFIPSQDKLVIDFTSVDWDRQSQMPNTPRKP